jgi:three-Cys-motif partner protein
MRAHFELWWVELFAGPGRLYVEPLDELVDGSPLEALAVRHPFHGYLFADLDAECVAALKTRVSQTGHRNAHVRQADANGEPIRRVAFELIRPDALVELYLDPEGLELNFATIKLLAERLPRLDLIVNFPVRGVVRYVSAGHVRLAQSLLGITDTSVLAGENGQWSNVRAAMNELLDELGFSHRTRRQVRLEHNRAGLYDLVVASRDPTAVRLFERANAIEPHGQRTFLLGA